MNDLNSPSGENKTIAEVIASEGPMEEKKALGIISLLCSRCLDDAEAGAGVPHIFDPRKILFSPSGKISFPNDTKEPADMIYLPPKYKKGETPQENTAVYGLGMLLLFLVTGQEKKSGMDTGVNNPVIREAVLRCTALDSKRRFQSLQELYDFITREIKFPKKRLKRVTVILAVFLMLAGSLYAYLSADKEEYAAGESSGYRTGYREGYENGVSDAPGIGIEETGTRESFGSLPGSTNSKNGAFALYNGKNVYFICGGNLYEMDPYTKKLKFLTGHGQLSHLSFKDGRLYYLADGTIMRMDPEEGEEQTVSERISGPFSIYDGTLYVDDEKSAGYLYGIDLATLESRQLNSETEYHSLKATDRKLYYIDPDRKSYLFSSDHDGGNETRLMSKACRDVDLCGENIYCLVTEGSNDPAAADAPGILTRLDTEGGNMETLTGQPVRRFAATEGGIFYISDTTGYLEWISADGETEYTVCDFPVLDFNIAGRWIFYSMGSEDSLYRMRLDGTETEKLY